MSNHLYQYYEQLCQWSAVRRFSGRHFNDKNRCNVLVICDPNRISYSQIYPFFYYRSVFRERFNVELRLVPLPAYETPAYQVAHHADVILLQTWFTVEPAALEALVAKIQKLNPASELHFLDSFAPTDLRLARILAPLVKSYIKKSVLKDRSQYQKPQLGDTNLMEYYCGLFDIEEKMVDWQVPMDVMDKLVIGPTFFTSPLILESFLNRSEPPSDNKTLDVHARMAAKGSSWYGKMRQLSVDKLNALTGLKTAVGPGIPRKQFMRELATAKICFSPFGYGEICWRDIEAIQAGAVLLKPSMEHLDMNPRIHIPFETYIPLQWDYSDLEEKIESVLSNDTYRKTLVSNAYQMVRAYLQEARFVDQFAYLFTRS